LSSSVVIAIDCMGGDHGAPPIVEGALAALHESEGRDLSLILVGDKPQIESALKHSQIEVNGRLSIEHAPDVVPMDARPSDVLRLKTSSIAVGMQMHREGRVQAFISPGNTGAVMATALHSLERLPGVLRPAIASLFPNPRSATIVLDVGANAECKPQHLAQFAVMGSSFSQLVLKHPQPRVGLLSIGEEKSKGTETTQEAHRLLSQVDEIRFVGNIEGRDVMSGEIDVAVTDGFVGNILLKFAESVGPLLENKLRHQIRTNLFSRMGAVLMTPFLRRLRQSLDYAEHGGALLLGVDGVIVICHGSSEARAIKNAVFEAERSVRRGVNLHIREHLKRVQENEPQPAT
jgi:glycerol-3-phosphate acyltransferase PlsX